MDSRYYKDIKGFYLLTGDMKYNILDIPILRYHTEEVLSLFGYAESFLSDCGMEHLRNRVNKQTGNMLKENGRV